MSPIIVIFAGFIAVAALVGGVAMLVRRDPEDKIQDRLTQLTTGRPSTASAAPDSAAGAHSD